MTDSSQDTDAAADSLTHEAKLLVELMRVCRVTLLYGDPGARRDHLLHSEIVPLLQAVRPSGQRELVLLFDAWGGPPLTALHAHIHTALAQITTESIPDSASGQPFADVLRSWQEACNATFLIIFDHFNEYLIAPSEDYGMRAFEDEFVQAVNNSTLRANFLLVLDKDAEPLLERLRDRIPFLGNDLVRLPSVKTARKKQPADFFDAVSGRPMLALAIVFLICAVPAAAVWFAQRVPQPEASLTEAWLAAQKSLAVEGPPRERMELNEPDQPPTLPMAAEEQSASAAAKAMAQTKPKARPSIARATAARPSNANAGRTQENPKLARTHPRVAPAPSMQPPERTVPPAEPKRAATAATAFRPRPTIDQVHEQRAGEECERGLLGVVCREKIRYQLCAGKWTRDEQPGITRCYVWVPP